MRLTRTKLLAATLAAIVSLALFVPIGGAQPYYQQITGSIVSATTQFRAAAGSSAVPSYSFTSDPDTGLKSSAANVVGLVVGGVERFTFGSAGLGLKGSTSGTITLAVPAAAGTNTITLPAGTTDFSATGGTSQVVKQTSSGGAFTVARLACADLSDGATGCSTATGTSGATIPLLSGANSWGGVQTFGANISNTQTTNATVTTETRNNSNGASAAAAFYATNDGAQTLQLGQLSSGYTTSGILVANASYIYAPHASGLAIIGAAGPVKISASGTSAIATVSSTGVAVVGTITASAIASSGAAQSGYLCYNTSGGVITYDGGATCLVSREEFKNNLGPITNALRTVKALRPFWGEYKADSPMADHRVQPFFGARHTAKVDQRLISVDARGEPLGVRYENMTAVLAAAIQEQQTEIDALRKEVSRLRSIEQRLAALEAANDGRYFVKAMAR